MACQVSILQTLPRYPKPCGHHNKPRWHHGRRIRPKWSLGRGHEPQGPRRRYHDRQEPFDRWPSAFFSQFGLNNCMTYHFNVVGNRLIIEKYIFLHSTRYLLYRACLPYARTSEYMDRTLKLTNTYSLEHQWRSWFIVIRLTKEAHALLISLRKLNESKEKKKILRATNK